MTFSSYLAGRGLDTVRECVEDPVLGAYVRRGVFDEILPLLPLPAQETRAFAEDVMERLANPFIKHNLISIALNSVSKFAARVLPSIKAFQQRQGRLPRRLTFSLAALLAKEHVVAAPSVDRLAWQVDEAVVQRALENLREDFGTRPLFLRPGGGEYSPSYERHTARSDSSVRARRGQPGPPAASAFSGCRRMLPPSCSVFHGVPSPESQAAGHWPMPPGALGVTRVRRPRPGIEKNTSIRNEPTKMPGNA